MSTTGSKRRKFRRNIAYYLQTRPFIHPPCSQQIACVLYATRIVSHHVLLATRISAALIFTHAQSATTTIAAGVLTTIAPTVTGAIPILLPN